MSEAGGDRNSGQNRGRLAGFLPYQLSVASNAVSDLIAERYRKRFALKIPEWRVMAILGDHGAASIAGEGAMTQRALTAATLMDKVAVNRAVKVLEERGLVARVPNPIDGRSHLLALTEEGLIKRFNAGVVSASGNAGAIIEFKVDDVDSVRAGLGDDAVIAMEPTDMPWGNRSMLLRDPDGNAVNLFSRPGR